MPPPHISLHELYAVDHAKAAARRASYDKVLELCHRRVRTVAAYGGRTTFFEVPGYVPGFPLYNLTEATEHVVTSLRKVGFAVQLLPPPHVAVLYVSWEPREIDAARRGGSLLAAPAARPSIAALLPF